MTVDKYPEKSMELATCLVGENELFEISRWCV